VTRNQHDSTGWYPSADDNSAAAIALRYSIWGGVLMLIGFLMGIGMAEPETPGEEDTFAKLMVAALAILLLGFLLQCVALAVGLVGRRRLDPNEHDQRLDKAIRISGSVVAVGVLFIAIVAANTL
jgi:uncharacterized membrane protein